MYDMRGSQISEATAAVPRTNSTSFASTLTLQWQKRNRLGEVDDVSIFAPCILVKVSVLLQLVSYYYLFVNEDGELGDMPRIGNKCFSLSFPPLAWGPL
jgi:hypothetical protein